MLYLTLSDGCEIEWHVGEKKPAIFQPRDRDCKKREVRLISADGDELEFLNRIPHIPYPVSGSGSRIKVWEDSNARWIFNNWPWTSDDQAAVNDLAVRVIKFLNRNNKEASVQGKTQDEAEFLGASHRVK